MQDIHPIFEPEAWRLTDQEAGLAKSARQLGAEKFAARAADWDRDATFPIENYKDMHQAGLLAICIPKANGGQGGGLTGSRSTGDKHETVKFLCNLVILFNLFEPAIYVNF